MATDLKLIEKTGNLLRRGWLFMQCNKPSVMTGMAMGGAIVLAGSSAKSAVRTYQLKDQIEDLEFIEKAKVVAPEWIETMIILLFVEIMIFGANRENARRIATLASALSLSEQDLKTYRDKAEEIVGPKKTREIEHEIAKDYAAKENMNERIYDTGHGRTLVKDLSTGRKFYNDLNYIEAVVNELNNDLNQHGPASSNPNLYFVTKNDFYRAIGLEEVEGGEDLGWNSYSGDLIAITMTPQTLPNNVDVIHYMRLENLSPTYTDEFEAYSHM